MTSEELPQILQRWWKPPRTKKLHVAQADGAHHHIEKLSMECALKVIQGEMTTAKDFLQSTEDSFFATELSQLRISDIIGEMKKNMPNLWDILHSAITCEDATIRKLILLFTYSSQIFMIYIAILAYSRNQNYNLIQRMLAIYFRFNGLTACAFDSLHYLGVVMSMKWTTNIVEKIGTKARESLLALRDNNVWFLCHNNLNIPFHVYLQQVEQHTHFDSGAAGTCFVISGCRPLLQTLPIELQTS